MKIGVNSTRLCEALKQIAPALSTGDCEIIKCVRCEAVGDAIDS